MNRDSLLAAAQAARLKAYAPYSKFLVGAALLTEDDILVTGSNTENATYGLTVCAERVAIFSAVHAGYRHFKQIAVVSDTNPPSSPCGACRQVLWELAGNIEVIMGNLSGVVNRVPLSDLLPLPFGTAANWQGNTVDAQQLAEAEMWRLPVPLNPLGYVVNEFLTPDSIRGRYKETLSQIVLRPELADGLYRLDEEERIIVIGHLHQARSYSLKEKRSGRGDEVFGVFACRAPLRPNALSQTIVELVSIENNVITVRGLDLINGTPVMDIKTDYR